MSPTLIPSTNSTPSFGIQAYRLAFTLSVAHGQLAPAAPSRWHRTVGGAMRNHGARLVEPVTSLKCPSQAYIPLNIRTRKATAPDTRNPRTRTHHRKPVPVSPLHAGAGVSAMPSTANGHHRASRSVASPAAFSACRWSTSHTPPRHVSPTTEILRETSLATWRNALAAGKSTRVEPSEAAVVE